MRAFHSTQVENHADIALGVVRRCQTILRDSCLNDIEYIEWIEGLDGQSRQKLASLSAKMVTLCHQQGCADLLMDVITGFSPLDGLSSKSLRCFFLNHPQIAALFGQYSKMFWLFEQSYINFLNGCEEGLPERGQFFLTLYGDKPDRSQQIEKVPQEEDMRLSKEDKVLEYEIAMSVFR